MATVLFVCNQNAGRSQMSDALSTRAADGTHQALSAGTSPAGHVHPGSSTFAWAGAPRGIAPRKKGRDIDASRCRLHRRRLRSSFRMTG
jgi:protein-tyrosine-phosphatase